MEKVWTGAWKSILEEAQKLKYKVVQIWPGRFVCKQVTVCPGHIWTTLYISSMMNMMLWNLLNSVDLDGLCMWWWWKKVIQQRKSFVLNLEEMEIKETVDQTWGGATWQGLRTKIGELIHTLMQEEITIQNVTTRSVRVTTVAVKNQYHIFVCVCVNARAWAFACVCVRVVLLMQHATRMRHIVTSFVASLAWPYF